MNLDELRSVQSKERQKDSLQQLRDSFYQDVAAYIADLRAERDRRAEQVDNPFSDDEVRQLSDELDTAEEVAEALYERRVGKVVKLASFAAADMSAGEEGLTVEEQALFDDLVDRIKQNKASVLDVLAGEGDVVSADNANDAANTASAVSATDATQPTQAADTAASMADNEPTTIGGANADHTPSPAAETPEQPPPEQAADDGMLADAMGAATERGSTSDGTAADNPARRAGGDTNTAERPTEATHNDAERTDGEGGVPTTDGGSTTAAAPPAESTPTESTPSTESTPTTKSPPTESTPPTKSTPPAESTSTAPSQPSSASPPADDGATEATMATPETAAGSTESATQSAKSVTQSTESVTQPPAPATEQAGDHDHPTDRSTADAGTEASNTEAVSTDTAHSESIDRTTVRITESVGAILGVDEREYILTREDVVTLPTANAEALLSQDAAIKLG